MMERNTVFKVAIARQKSLLDSLVFSHQREMDVSSPRTPSRIWPGVKSSRLCNLNIFNMKRTARPRARARATQG